MRWGSCLSEVPSRILDACLPELDCENHASDVGAGLLASNVEWNRSVYRVALKPPMLDTW